MNEKYTIEIDGKMYPVKIVAKNITRVIVKVDYANKIALHHPRTCSFQEAISHLQRQMPWLEKVVRKNEITIRNMHVSEVAAGKKIWLFGNLYNIDPAAQADFYHIADNTLYISGDLKKIINQIRLALSEKIREEFNQFASGFAESFQKKATLSFRKMRSRWGSCNAKTGNINLNLLLVHVPPLCYRYVIIHEFIHFIYAHHNHDFYRLLEKFFPDYKIAVKELKKYSFILRI